MLCWAGHAGRLCSGDLPPNTCFGYLLHKRDWAERPSWGEMKMLVSYMSSISFSLTHSELISRSLYSGTGRSVQNLRPWALSKRAKGEVSERKNFTFSSQNRGYQCHNGCPQGFLQETPRATAHLPAQQSLYRSSRWGLITHNIAVYGVFILGLNNTIVCFFSLKKSWTMETAWPWFIGPSVSCLDPTETL